MAARKKKKAAQKKESGRSASSGSEAPSSKKKTAIKPTQKKAKTKKKGSSVKAAAKKKRKRVPREPQRTMPDEIGIMDLWRWLTNRLIAVSMLASSIEFDELSSVHDAPDVVRDELLFVEKLNKLRIRHEQDIVVGHHGNTPITRNRLWIALWQRVLGGIFNYEKQHPKQAATEKRIGRLETLRVLQEYIGIAPTDKDVEILLKKPLIVGGEQAAQEVIQQSSYGISKRALDDVVAWLNGEGGTGDPGLSLWEDDMRRGPKIPKSILLEYFLRFVLRIDVEDAEAVLDTFHEVSDLYEGSSDAHVWRGFQAHLRKLQGAE